MTSEFKVMSTFTPSPTHVVCVGAQLRPAHRHQLSMVLWCELLVCVLAWEGWRFGDTGAVAEKERKRALSWRKWAACVPS